MEVATRTVVLAGLGVVLAAAAAILLLGRGDSASSPNASADQGGSGDRPQATSAADPEATATSRRELVLPDRGHPVVWVREGHEVELRATPGGPPVRTVGDETEFGSPRVFSVFQVEGEWAGVPSPFTGNGELGWLRLDGRDLIAGYTRLEVVVDLSERRAELHRNGEVARAFTVSVGAPGTETPAGRFAVTDSFRGDLNPAYGCCAVALTAEQPNLPSGWLGGDRIAIHGTSGPLGAESSSGCVRAADRDVSALVDRVPPGAPVTVRQ